MLGVGLASGVAGVVGPGWKEDGPYTLRPNVDASSFLSYTPLTLSVNNITGAFVKAMPKYVQKVPNVAPFGACFSSKNISSTRLGPAVPTINLVLQSKNIGPDDIRMISYDVTWKSVITQTTPRPILQVTKDAKTLQYVTQVSQRTPLVPVKLTIDLGGEFMWVNCQRSYTSSSYLPATCGSPQCKLLNTTSCLTQCLGPPSLDCANNTCSTFPINTISNNTGTGGLIHGDVFVIQVTDGENILPSVSVPSVYFVCGTDFLNEGLADEVTGMAGLGRTGMSLPAQLSSYFGFNRKFALCLSSSTTSSGAVFFGDGPYTLSPNVGASSSFTYTPLIINPVSESGFAGDASPKYYIGVKSIYVSHKRVTGFNETLLSINAQGLGGTAISTADPYTVLESSIYNALIEAFVEKMPRKVQKVANVAPFGACFSSMNISRTSRGPIVPSIDLVLQSRNIWRIFGANSMVAVNKDVMCLGFVQARANLTTTIPIVIGGHQIEDNLLQFDLTKSRLGFSSSIFRRTSCGNFNFTSSA
ncbi:Aspartic peptidase [Artemisia annua]|uniref:Aspartic peptidase n=1 Tax=Artemisia annua TaxID=35608 RepID=A0A2U1ML41_ARTAN|nr:Aspartic peptidase [Artemisia annua]